MNKDIKFEVAGGKEEGNKKGMTNRRRGLRQKMEGRGNYTVIEFQASRWRSIMMR